MTKMSFYFNKFTVNDNVRLAQLLDGVVIRLFRGIELVSERVRTVWLELSVSRV